MSKMQLRTPPIVEALLEVKWGLKDTGVAELIDPDYQLLLGSFWQLIKASYPHHERLPAASIPDEVTGAVVKHRFRVAKDEWPLIQLGPGIMSVNETQKYTTFDKFKPLAVDAIKRLFEAYPGDLDIRSLMLRYIDAVDMDYSQEDVVEFVREQMHIPASLPEFLSQDINLDPKPANFAFKVSLRSKNPTGTGTLSVSTGLRDGKRSLIWEQIIHSSGDDVCEMPARFDVWLDQAHALIEGWFWKMIEGKLQERFNHA